MKLPPTEPLEINPPLTVDANRYGSWFDVRAAVYQDGYGPDGNCLSACLATLMEIPLEGTRHFQWLYMRSVSQWERMDIVLRTEFLSHHGECPWQVQLALFLRPRGKTPAYPMATTHGVRRLPPSGWAIAMGGSKNGGGHAGVAFDGELVHDPNPRKVKGAADWGLREIEHYVVLLEGVRQ